MLGSFLVGISRNSWPLALLVSSVQIIQPMVDVRILRALKFDPRLERVRDPVILALVAGPAGAFLAAVSAIGVYFVVGRIPQERLAYEFVLWWMRDWLGVMVAATLVFAWAYGREIKWTWRRAGEGLALFITLFLSSQVMFGLWGLFASRNVPIAFVFFPIVGWAGLRFGPRGAATVVALISGFAIAIAGMRVGPFSEFPIEFVHALFSSFLSLGALSGLLLAAIMAERDDAMHKRLLLEEQLRHSQKMEAVGRLAGGIAHDFNNIMTVVLGHSELLALELKDHEDMRSSVNEIQHAAERAASLTRQLLAFSRQQKLDPAPVDLNLVANDMVALLSRVLGGEIEVRAETGAEPVTIATDRAQLEQALLNLAVNARDAMPEGGRLVLTVSRRPPADGGGEVGVMQVADTGSGIPPEVQAHIFDPFFTTKEVGRGSGLGLAMVYGFVQQSGGTIQFDTAIGKGTTFELIFPLVTPAGPAEAATC